MNAVQCLALAHNPDTQTEISFTPNAVLLRARFASASDTVQCTYNTYSVIVQLNLAIIKNYYDYWFVLREIFE